MINENNALHYWAALAIFSIVSLSSMTNFLEDGKDLEREQMWAVTVASVSLILAVVSFFLRMFMTKMFTENFFEQFAVRTSSHCRFENYKKILQSSKTSFLRLGSLGLCCVGVLVCRTTLHQRPCQSPLRGHGWRHLERQPLFLKLDGVHRIHEAFSDMFPAKFMGDRFSTFTKHWIGFGTATLIVMTNAVMYWRDNCESKDDSNMCHRDLFAFVLGAVSGLFALAFMAFNHERLEQVTSIFLTAAWCFAIAYLTFDDGPAKYVGTFYFSVWFSFMFSFWMAVHSIVTLYSGVSGTDDTPAPEEGKGAQEATAKQDAEEHEKEEVAPEGV
jgi:hypothetical protein